MKPKCGQIGFIIQTLQDILFVFFYCLLNSYLHCNISKIAFLKAPIENFPLPCRYTSRAAGGKISIEESSVEAAAASFN